MKKIYSFLGSMLGGVLGILIVTILFRSIPSLATSTSSLWSWVFPSQGYTVPLPYGIALNTTATTYGGLAGAFNTQTTSLAVFSSTTGLVPIFEIDQNGKITTRGSGYGLISGITLWGNNITTSGSATLGSASIGSHTPWTIGSCTLAYTSVTNSNVISVQCPANNNAIMGSVSCNPVNIIQSCPSSFSSGCTLSAGFSNTYWNGVCASAPANAYVWALCCPTN